MNEKWTLHYRWMKDCSHLRTTISNWKSWGTSAAPIPDDQEMGCMSTDVTIQTWRHKVIWRQKTSMSLSSSMNGPSRWQSKHTCWRTQKTGWCRTTRIKPQPVIIIVSPHTVTSPFAIRFRGGEFCVIQRVVVDPPEVTFLIYVAQTDPGMSWKTNFRRK